MAAGSLVPPVPSVNTFLWTVRQGLKESEISDKSHSFWLLHDLPLASGFISYSWDSNAFISLKTDVNRPVHLCLSQGASSIVGNFKSFFFSFFYFLEKVRWSILHRRLAWIKSELCKNRVTFLNWVVCIYLITHQKAQKAQITGWERNKKKCSISGVGWKPPRKMPKKQIHPGYIWIKYELKGRVYLW